MLQLSSSLMLAAIIVLLASPLPALAQVSVPGTPPVTWPGERREYPIVGFAGMRKTIDARAAARGFGRLDGWSPPPADDGAVLFHRVRVDAEGKVEMVGVSTSTTGKRIAGITALLEYLKKSPLDEIRLTQVVWVPVSGETYGGFHLVAKIPRVSPSPAPPSAADR